MKQFLFLALFLCSFAYTSRAQVDVQINPIGLLFSSVDLSAEIPVSPDFGIEGVVGYDFQNFKFDDVKYKNNAFSTRVIGKYYFNPGEASIKGFNVGAYLRYSTGTASVSDEDSNSGDVINTKLGLGVYTGYKWVSKRNVVFELGLGMGRKLIRTYEYSDGSSADTSDIPFLNFDIFGRFSIGYRFGGSKASK